MSRYYICLHVSQLASCMGLDRYRSIDKALDSVWQRVDLRGYQVAHNRCRVVPYHEAIKHALSCDVSTQQGIQEFSRNVGHFDSRATGEVAANLASQYSKRYGTHAVGNVAQEIQSSIFTCYGTARERSVFDAINARQVLPCNVKEDNTFFSQPGGVVRGMEWYIGGRMDAILEDRSGIVEIKNRIYKLFNRIRPHDMVQIQAYAQLVNTPKAYLVECYRHHDNKLELGVMAVTRDDDMWNNWVVPRLAAFVEMLLDILDSPLRQDDFILAPDRTALVNNVIDQKLFRDIPSGPHGITSPFHLLQPTPQ